MYNGIKCWDSYGMVYIRRCLLSSHHNHNKFYDSQSGSYITKPGSSGIRYHDNYLRYKFHEKSSSNDILNDNYVVKYILSLVDNNSVDNNRFDNNIINKKDEIKSYSMSYYNKTIDFKLFIQKSLSYLHRNNHKIPLKLSILIDDIQQLYDIQSILLQSSSSSFASVSSSSSSSSSSSFKVAHENSNRSISNNINIPDKDRIINELLEVEFDFILDNCHDNVNGDGRDINVEGDSNEDKLSLMKSFSSILRQYNMNSRVNVFINIDHCIHHHNQQHHHHADKKAYVDTIAIGKAIGNICDLGLNIINLTLFYSNPNDPQYFNIPLTSTATSSSSSTTTTPSSSIITTDRITNIDSTCNSNNNKNNNYNFNNNNNNIGLNNKMMYLDKDKVIDYVREIIEECLFLDVVGDPLIERLSIQLSSQLPELKHLAHSYGITRYSICKGSIGGGISSTVHYARNNHHQQNDHHQDNSMLYIL